MKHKRNIAILDFTDDKLSKAVFRQQLREFDENYKEDLKWREANSWIEYDCDRTIGDDPKIFTMTYDRSRNNNR